MLSLQQQVTAGNPGVTPPDTQMAVGPADVVEMVNQMGQRYTRAGAANGAPFDLGGFFKVPSTSFMTDPRLLYDAPSGRWFAAAVSFQCDPLGTCATILGGEAYVAVSKSSDPAPTNWDVYTLAANSTGTLYDQPKLGVADDKVVVAFDDYGAGGNAFTGAEVRVVKKADLLAAAATPAADAFAPNANRFSIAPAQSLSSTTTAYAVYNNADGASGSPVPQSQSTPTVGLLTITGVPNGINSSGTAMTESFLPIQSTSVPPDAPEKGTSGSPITTNDDRFLHSVWQNGLLWTFGNDGCTPTGDTATRSCARLVQIRTAPFNSVVQDFDAGVSGAFIYYPSLSFNANGDTIGVFSQSASNQYVTVVAGGQLSTETGRFSPLVTVKAGEATYNEQDTDPTTCFGPTGSPSRWGDYSAAVRDPLDGNSVWVAGEYAAAPGADTPHCNWGTAAGRLTFAGPTASSVSPQTGKNGGGDFVTITGTNFTAGSQVLFNTVPAASTTVVSSTTITVVTPNLSDVTADVFVRTPYGTTVPVKATKFRFTAPPAVTAVTPNVGPLRGGNNVTLTGSHFTAATAVRFGSAPAASFLVQSDTKILAVPPAHAPATVDVRVDVGTVTGVTGPGDKYTWADRSGYWMVDRLGDVFAFGDSKFLGGLNGARTNVVDIEPTASGNGYWVLDEGGEVFAFGDAVWQGQPTGFGPGEIATSMSANPAGTGYWVFTNRGRAFPYGDAQFFGDMAGRALNGPVLGSVATPTGRGYYMVASDGGIFAFGDAQFRGSMGGRPLNGPVVGLAPDPDNVGYWLVATDGGIFAFDAVFRGSMGGQHLNQPVVGMVAYGDGYLMVASDGGIFDFSSKPFLGSLGGQALAAPIVNVAPLNG
jgi:hypothetical protein